jgi:hypothetical protein
MRIYFQQQIRLKPVTTEESSEIIQLSKRFYKFTRWEFSNGEFISEMLVLNNPINDDYESKIFKAFVHELEVTFPTIKFVKLQFYSVHEIPTTCFVHEEKVKRDKLTDILPSTPFGRDYF